MTKTELKIEIKKANPNQVIRGYGFNGITLTHTSYKSSGKARVYGIDIKVGSENFEIWSKRKSDLIKLISQIEINFDEVFADTTGNTLEEMIEELVYQSEPDDLKSNPCKFWLQ